MKTGPLLAVAVVASWLAGSVTADAAIVRSRSFYSTPVALCQSALPAFETQIRKRPLAVQNEGNANAFVTCAFTSQRRVRRFEIYFIAYRPGVVSITCTGIAGHSPAGPFVTRTVTVGHTGQGVIDWRPSHFDQGGNEFQSGLFSVSCTLPPGGAIADTEVAFTEDVGW